MAIYNEDDQVGITVDKNSNTDYFPPEIVTYQDLQNIIDQYSHSQKTETDTRRVLLHFINYNHFKMAINKRH
ncbi:hypothetical protein [Lapidilactobacillus bayanensis]|uniref:hypothetical protein n=1 Tax=Lapidilactobacillus bayanensis TaxID=2485998 RepID=UPI001CDD7248|nr:hypothetical protein [Lapidilactobacillus bayanensis]